MKTDTHPLTLSAGTITGDAVVDGQNRDLGTIREIMLDVRHGKIAYAVLSFGGFLGLGDKLFAIPWDMLTIDTANKRFTLQVTKEQLERAEGFDKDNWPSFADESFHDRVYALWGRTPYWRR